MWWNPFRRKPKTSVLKSFRPRESQLKMIDPDFPNEYEGRVAIKTILDRYGGGRNYQIAVEAKGYGYHWKEVDFAWYNSVEQGDKVWLLVSRDGQKVKMRRVTETPAPIGARADVMYRLVEHQQVYSDGRSPLSTFEVQTKQGEGDWIPFKSFTTQEEAEALYQKLEYAPSVAINTYVLK